MLNEKYQPMVEREIGEGEEKITYFKARMFISKGDFKEILGNTFEEVSYNDVSDAIAQMLHDGEYRTVFIGKTISLEAYNRVYGYDIKQFIYKGVPGFWIEMKI